MHCRTYGAGLVIGRLLARLIGRPSAGKSPACRENSGSGIRANYCPDVFDVENLDQAKRIILTEEQGLTSEERWRVETPYLAEEIVRSLSLKQGDLLLDYGCGIGRLSRALIERCDCAVVGVDISRSMRQMAEEYVASDRFCALSPDMLSRLIEDGLRFDAAIAVWVLQHCPDVVRDLRLIGNALRETAPFFVVNNEHAAVPSDRGWLNDGTDIRKLLTDAFASQQFSRLPAHVSSEFVSANTFTAVFRNKR